MNPTAESIQQEYKDEAEKNRLRAQRASTPSLREFYEGKAEAYQRAADGLTKLVNRNITYEDTE